MGVKKYKLKSGQTCWKVELHLSCPDGRLVRFRKLKIPTREQAEALAAKMKAEAFEGRYFDRVRTPKVTVMQLWADYEPITKRDNDAWLTDRGRAAHLVRHLGERMAHLLTQADVDGYRTMRLSEKTKRGGPPSPATLDREVELLKRMLNYTVACQKLPANPLASVKLLNKPNVREKVLTERDFARLVEAADEPLRPILLVAYDSGMRKTEVLGLRWSQVDLKTGTIRLAPRDTKTEKPRVVYLTRRAFSALRAAPRRPDCDEVFLNPKTGRGWKDIRKMFRRACRAAGISGLWFHDNRRSFCTNARRRKVPESVVMRMSGHKTRSVFDRYNTVDEDDVKQAVTQIEAGIAADSGQDLVTAGVTAPKSQKPHQLSADEASDF